MKNVLKALKRKLSRRRHAATGDGMLEVVEDSPYYPFSVKQNDDGEYTVSLYAEDEYKIDNFEDHELIGNGDDWQRLAEKFIRMEMPEVEGKIKFDPEADMFFAYCDDEETLVRFVAGLKDACEDDAKLKHLLENIDEE